MLRAFLRQGNLKWSSGKKSLERWWGSDLLSVVQRKRCCVALKSWAIGTKSGKGVPACYYSKPMTSSAGLVSCKFYQFEMMVKGNAVIISVGVGDDR